MPVSILLQYLVWVCVCVDRNNMAVVILMYQEVAAPIATCSRRVHLCHNRRVL